MRHEVVDVAGVRGSRAARPIAAAVNTANRITSVAIKEPGGPRDRLNAAITRHDHGAHTTRQRRFEH